jgi:phage terminase Nu1 subunit (DNA packaging protein)
MTRPTPPGTRTPSPCAEARTRRETARARLEELKLAESEGRVLDAEQVEATWSRIIAVFRSLMLAIPTRLAPRCEQQPRAVVFEQATTLIHEALAELSQVPDTRGAPPPRRSRSA